METNCSLDTKQLQEPLLYCASQNRFLLHNLTTSTKNRSETTINAQTPSPLSLPPRKTQHRLPIKSFEKPLPLERRRFLDRPLPAANVW